LKKHDKGLLKAGISRRAILKTYPSVIYHRLIPNPDKPERIATKAPRHKEKMFSIN